MRGFPLEAAVKLLALRPTSIFLITWDMRLCAHNS